jgi:glyoxylase-like metal-dependent hydrolase (beta-lactamase superfamily II)
MVGVKAQMMDDGDFRPGTVKTQWGTLVFYFVAPNPGAKTLEGTCTYVLFGEACYVIDPGPEIPAYQRFLAAWIRAARQGERADGILLTHGHPDHAPGADLIGSLLGAPIYASPRLDRRFLPPDTFVRPIGDGYAFHVGDQRLTAITAPGHSQDHLAFWLEDDRILFAGDTVLGRGTSLVAPPEGNMRLYMETLERLQALDPRIICPGHGPIIRDPSSKLAEYIEHRRKREEQVVEALHHGPATARELVERIYTDTDSGLHDLAEGSVRAQLQKLEEEGRVRSVNDRYHLS